MQVVLSAFPCSGVDRGVAVPGLGGPPLHTTRPATDAPTRHQPVAASCLRATSLFTSHGPAPTVCVPYDINPLLFPSLPTSSLSILNLSNQHTHLDSTPTSIPIKMKSYAVLAATFAGVALSQDIPMPSGDCANLCINNMARIAQTEFSCASDDIGCFCTQSNWAYGIRDCSRQACDADQSAQAVSWAYARCAGVAATATGSGAPAALPILTSAVASATAVAPGSMVTSVITSVVSSAASGAESVTSSVGSAASSALASGESAISSALESASSALASASASISSELASATDSAGNAISSATDSAGSAIASATDSAGSAISSATDAAGSAASSAGSAASSVAEGAAPMVTGIPFAAGAGIAAWLLL
ncbi:hypothetical protein IG631_21205 [Alternaria alternata]|nr:hypothetical protein IG631_21205 [Alternaria alternata]